MSGLYYPKTVNTLREIRKRRRENDFNLSTIVTASKQDYRLKDDT